jgi:hypothetical protein
LEIIAMDCKTIHRGVDVRWDVDRRLEVNLQHPSEAVLEVYVLGSLHRLNPCKDPLQRFVAR